MPRAFAPRDSKNPSARKRLITAAAALTAACWVAFGLAPFSTQVVRSQGAGGAARSLSVAERVMHQRALDEVYWRHTSWPQENKTPKPSLDEVMTHEQTAAKVEDALRKSEALAKRFGRSVTPEQLQAEVARMARETKRPAILRELFAALGNDPFVIAEVLARPALVDRLTLSSFEAGERAEAESFDAWWAETSGEFVAEAPAASDFNYQLTEINQASAGADDTWSPTQALPIATGSAVWTGAEVIIWGGTTQYGGRTNSGSRYNPATDTWSSTSTVGAPRERSGHAAYWTGTEMLIWGGLVGVNCGGDGPCRYDYTNTGGRYNPLTDTWTPTSTSGAPATSNAHTVWTGSKMIVLGSLAGTVYDPSSDTWKLTARSSTPGFVGNRAVWTGTEIFTWGGINNDTGMRGGLFNPETGTWRQPSTFNAPSERNNFSLVWTGTEAVVWGGFEGNNITLNTGGRYNPATDTWTPTSTGGAPAARYGHVAVWTGSEMIVHGGDLRPLGQMEPTNTGARYNPANDTWAAISTAGSPVKFQHVGVWTGAEVFVWGGSTGSGSFQKEGARFNPSNDSWTPVNNNDSPLYLDRGVWTGTEMLVWGQNTLCNCFTSVGGRYDPATNVWRPMNLAGAPVAGSKSYGTNALWTGKEMLVWGGGRGRYNPMTDSWAAISSAGAPAEGYTAVWSGSEMIVWGGSSTQGGADTGGRYNPETDTWRPTSTAGAPSGRYMHTAVWSGSEMIVWGGTTAGVAGKHNTGGRYNPETDTWRPTSTAGAPEGRTYHTAVWADSVMVVWGGMNDAVPASDSRLNTGGRYDPVSDTWTPTSTGGAPEARTDHRAIWTGSQMIVWGGIVKGVVGGDGTYTGARYNPQTDVWTPTSTLSAPSKRSQHVQVWTGTQMIVWGGIATEGAATHGAVYNAPGAPRAGNLPPAVRLTTPAGGTAYQSGDTVQLAAEVSDPDGAVTTVRFYANGQLVGTDRQAPFAFAWTDGRGGNYALTATATDDGGAEARSAEVYISITPSTAPPVCVLTAPAGGSTYAYGSSIRMEATMTPNRDRAIARVEFLVDGQMVTYYEPPTYNPPYSHTYTANASGARSLAARCTDNMGGVTTSAPKVVTVEEQGFSVSGQLLESANVPIANVRLRLDGPAGTAPQYMTTTVGGMGNYYFGGLKPGQNYKITLEAPNWRWSPDGATYTAISRSYTQQHFYGTRAGVAITGRLTDTGGNPVYPATVYLSGSKNAYTNVLSDGTYFFYGLAPGGTYSVQPYKNLYTFEPRHRTFENMSADQTADFVGAPQGTVYSVGGRVVDNKGAPVAGLRIKLSTTRVTGTHYRTTDADGRFSFGNVAANENVQLAPEDFTYKYTYAPVSHSFYGLSRNVTNADFLATPRTLVIAGRLTDNQGYALPAATVQLGGSATATATTNSDGSYFFGDLPSGGDYTVTPRKDGYAFTPPAKTFTGMTSNSAADFVGSPALHSVGGRVTLNGAALPGITVTLGGGRTATATTGADGRYNFTGLAAGGNYTVTPSGDYGFQPASKSYSGLSSGVTDADFTAATLTNLALGKAATQSSTGWGGTASRAVDGNTSGDWTHNSMSTTFSDAQAWWEVDLGSVQTIGQVKVWNRTDGGESRLSDFHVIVSDAPFASTALAQTIGQTGVSDFRVAGQAGRPTAVAVNRTGRYVRVQLAGTNYLTLSEVQVMGQAPVTAPTQPVNLARGKAAAQSSTGWGGVASRATDGNTDGNWANSSVTTTFSDTQAWWEVDLGSPQQISSVKVWNRTDCCGERLSNFHVLVSDAPFASQDLTATLAQAGVSSFHTAGAAGRSTAVSVNRTGRYVRVQLAGANYLSLAEVEVWGAQPSSATATTNLSLGKAAAQSSTGWGAVASRAVDGNTGGDWAKNSVTATLNDAQAWWEVDLGAVRSVQDVKLWNRTDCCGERLSDFYILVSDTPFASQDLTATLAQAGVSGYRKTGAAGTQTSVAVGRTGRYVRVQLTGTNYLSLAEVQVMGQ